MALHKIPEFPCDLREVRGLHLDDEVTAEEVDDVAVDDGLGAVAGLRVALPEGGVEVPFVEEADGGWRITRRGQRDISDSS